MKILGVNIDDLLEQSNLSKGDIDDLFNRIEECEKTQCPLISDELITMTNSDGMDSGDYLNGDTPVGEGALAGLKVLLKNSEDIV